MIVVYLDAYSRRFFFIFGEVIIFSCIFFKLNYSDARLFFFFFFINGNCMFATYLKLLKSQC